MWMLSFLPDAFLVWIINIVLLAGIVGTTISILFKVAIRWMPWIIPYRTLLQVVSIVLLLAGVYFKGGLAIEQEWRARVKDLEAKVAIAEAQSKDANTKIEKVYIDRVKVVKDTQVVIQEKLKTVEVKVDAECKIVPEAISILNDAAAGVKKK
jgi:hypothetical protein